MKTKKDLRNIRTKRRRKNYNPLIIYKLVGGHIWSKDHYNLAMSR